MPLHIIRQDITKIKCDAIVNAANNTLLGGGGVDGAIHRAAGCELLEECKTLNGCNTGYAKITKGYNLPSKYVIHTVGPIWRGGNKGEKMLLESCYKKSLQIAKEYNLNSIAFPLISSGVYGYPKKDALGVAVNVISEFLYDNEMDVYIVVFDKDAFEITKNIYDEVQEYIDANYINTDYEILSRRRAEILNESCYESRIVSSCYENVRECNYSLSLDDMLSNIDECFSVMLLKLIDLKKMNEVDCYKRANVSKQTWYKIMNEKNYRPSKNTIISFAIALKLTLEETKKLLSSCGFTLSKSNKFDIIIEYFILKEEYDIFVINETLFKFDQMCLGV